MLSLFRAAAALALKSSPSSPSPQFHQHKSCPSLGEKRTASSAVLTDPSDLQVMHAASTCHPPVPTCCPSEITLAIANPQRPPFLTPLAPYPGTSDGAGYDIPTEPDTSLDASADFYTSTSIVHSPCSSFPVFGPFELLHSLQSGGYGTAWAAKDRSTGLLLCLKAFKSLESPSIRRSIRVELKIFKRIAMSRRGERGKQFLMGLNRSIQHDQSVFFAMELMTIDLDMYMSTQPERCKLHARRWVAQMALGIQSLHDMGIFHRDIKPENILIDPRENVRIIDFGLSYIGRRGASLCRGSGYATDFLGTITYMAPEVLRNRDLSTDQRGRYGIAVDWWALGCLLFELESPDNQPLFEREEHVHAYIARSEMLVPLEQPYKEFEILDPVVANLLEGLLQVQPATRYSLSDMEKHAYFLHRNGTSEFDNATSQALDRPVRPELVPQFSSDGGPSEVVEAAKSDSLYDWTNHDWACLEGVETQMK